MTHSVALTGGTGFIGNTVLPTLLAAGHSVRLLVRNPDKFHGRFDQQNFGRLQIVAGSLQHHSALQELLDGVDTIVHCAGRVRGRRAEEFLADNVIGTQALLDADTNPSHFIFISTLAAREPVLSDYASSKMQAEQLVQGRQTNNWTIIRPPAVYGPGDRELRPLFDWIRRGVLWVPGAASNRFSLLHVSDLAALIKNTVETGPLNSKICEPCDGKVGGYQWTELQAIAANVFNRRIRRFTVPERILNTAAHANMVFSSIINNSPMLTPGKVRELVHRDWVSDPKNVISGWHPQISLKAGLQDLYSEDH